MHPRMASVQMDFQQGTASTAFQNNACLIDLGRQRDVAPFMLIEVVSAPMSTSLSQLGKASRRRI